MKLKPFIHWLIIIVNYPSIPEWILKFNLNSNRLFQYFVKKLSGNSAIIYKFIDIAFIFSRVCINTEHVNKSLKQ